MLKFLAHKSYLWMATLGAEATGLAAMVSAVSKKDIAGMSAMDWFSLCSLYMMFIMTNLLARILLNQERTID